MIIFYCIIILSAGCVLVNFSFSQILLINCKTGLKLSENLASFAPQLEHLHWQDCMYHNESRVMFKPYSTDCEYSDSIMIKESMSQS